MEQITSLLGATLHCGWDYTSTARLSKHEKDLQAALSWKKSENNFIYTVGTYTSWQAKTFPFRTMKMALGH